tara:strand:+ start:4563 stop:5252 length:690 start_codon:yes stop_codon:yes gene_type:complete
MYVYSFYKFHKLGNLSSLKEEILRYMNKYSIKGTILLSHEGINVNISQEKYLLDLSIKDMNESINLTNVFINKTKSKEIAFQKIKVKIKNEIIRFNCSINNYSKQKKHLKSISPGKWEQLLDEDIQLIDMRNSFEYSLGTFKNAIGLRLKDFTDLKDRSSDLDLLDKNKKTAIFCTGGIRCEKAGLYLNELGFNKVYQLDGGIINYLNSSEKAAKWIGNCFVFDDRIFY